MRDHNTPVKIGTRHYLDRLEILLTVERLAFEALYIRRDFKLYGHLMDSLDQRRLALRS